MAIGKQKARESVSSKVRMLACVAQQPSVLSGSPSSMIENRRTERPQAHANDREMESRDKKMHEKTLAVLAKHFVTRLVSRHRAIADELAWRRAVNRGRSNRAWEWIVGAVFVIAIILTGYRLVQTQQHLETRQSELANVKQAADQAKAQATELARRAVSLNSTLEKADAQRNELQTKLDQATSEIESVQSQLEDKQSLQSELENAKQAADQTKAQATELAKQAASLNSELEKANAQRNELQTKLDQATSKFESAQSQLEDKQSRLRGMQSELENAKQGADQAKAQAMELAKRVASLNSALEKANAQRNELQTKLDQATSEITSAQSQLEDERPRLGGEQSELEDAKLAADQAKAQGADLAKRAASLKSQLEKANVNAIWSTPGNAGRQSDLVASYVNVGDFLMAQGNLAQALKWYREGLAVELAGADRLAKADPENAVWQHNVSLSYSRVGDVLMAQGNLAEALKSYQDGLTVADRLAKSNPENASWQRDVSISYKKIGDVIAASCPRTSPFSITVSRSWSKQVSLSPCP